MFDFDAAALTRAQFAFIVGFSIIFPAVAIGLASGRAGYLTLGVCWKIIFAGVFGAGVASRAAVLILAYTAHARWVFRGKVTLEGGYH